MACSINYSEFIGAHASRRRPALTRELTARAYLAPKSSISLAESMPNEVTFPFEKMEIQLRDGSSFTIEGEELNTALQYLPSQGYPPLVKTLREFTKNYHDPPRWDERDVIITNGSQDAISKSIEMSMEDGDPILIQDPLYTGTEAALKHLKAELIAIPQDEYGMSATHLAEVLEERKAKYTEEGGGCKMPKLLYVNPTGSNPSGTTMPLERRQEIYKIACQYNLLILEDDAYCFVDFSEVPSTTFISLDVEGRVLRFDSLSKVVSAGLRLGWVTGPKPLIRSIELHIQADYLHTSGLSQVVTEKLFETWGFDKMFAHMAFVREYYRARRDLAVASMERHLKGLCDWDVPNGGMCVWIKVRGVSDVYDMLMTRGLKKGITLVPGNAFKADQTKACNAMRASYSKATPNQFEIAMKLLAGLVREEQDLLRKKLENCT